MRDVLHHRKNQTITYTYDNLKRLITKAYPNTTSIQYTYQGQKLTQVVDSSASPSETHTFTYDDRFRVATNTQATRATITYTYDDADRTQSYALTGGPAASYMRFGTRIRLASGSAAHLPVKRRCRRVRTAAQNAIINYVSGVAGIASSRR